jgi:hypothetical protein
MFLTRTCSVSLLVITELHVQDSDHIYSSLCLPQCLQKYQLQFFAYIIQVVSTGFLMHISFASVCVLYAHSRISMLIYMTLEDVSLLGCHPVSCDK